MSFRRLFPLGGLLALAITASTSWGAKPADAYPPQVRKYYTQGEKLRDQERYKEAAAAYNEAIRLGMGDCAEIYLPLAECYRKLGEHAQVVATCSRLIEEFDLNSACRR